MCLRQQEALYIVEKEFVYTVINGVHAKVELRIKLGSSIDVLACFSRNVTEYGEATPQVRNLSHTAFVSQYDVQGKSILRPECVKFLISGRFCATQQLHLKKLKQILLSLPA